LIEQLDNYYEAEGSLDSAELVHEIAVVVSQAVVDGVVDGVMLQVVVPAGVGVVELLHLLALPRSLLLLYLSQQSSLKLPLLLALSLLHLLEDGVLMLV